MDINQQYDHMGHDYIEKKHHYYEAAADRALIFF
jgi:hypothetical protein